MIINAVSACWSSYSYEDSIRLIHEGTQEPIFGKLSSEHVQLCPQHSNYITEELIIHLMNTYPDIQFRLHADVRLKNKKGKTIDLINFNEENRWYFKELANLSKLMKAPLYSLHAGIRGNSNLDELFEKQQELQELFHCPVAVEGHYPFKNNHYLISNWAEYEQLYLSKLPYALDLSHLNIVAHRVGWDYDLTQEMLSSKQCKEIHLSFNNGILDSHNLSLEENLSLWGKWKTILEKRNKEAVVFSEGNQVLYLKKQARKS